MTRREAGQTIYKIINSGILNEEIEDELNEIANCICGTRALISSEFHRIYANNTDPLVKNLLDFIDSAKTQTVTHTNQPNKNDSKATDADSMYDRLEKYRLIYDEQSAILNYKSSESYKIDQKLRRGINLSENDKKLVQFINAALDKFKKYEGKVYRNIGILD